MGKYVRRFFRNYFSCCANSALSLLILCSALGHFCVLVSFALVPSDCLAGVQAVGVWGTLGVTLGSLKQQDLAHQGVCAAL